ncbi:hypothetical protein [Lysinibacillus sp. TE18511]
MEWRLGDSLGHSVRGTRVKRLIGRPQEALLCAKAKRQRQMFYLCESTAAANVLSVRKRSDSNNKAPSRNGNQPHVMVMIQNNSLLVIKNARLELFTIRCFISCIIMSFF